MSGETSQKSYEDQREPAWSFVGTKGGPWGQGRVDEAAQDRVRAVIMGWFMQSFIIQGWFYYQCNQKSLEGWRFSSGQLLIVSDSLRPHEPQHARPPCASPIPETTQIHLHSAGEAIQSSHPLSSPSPALNLAQHQSLFKWVSSSHQVAKLLELQLQHQSF